MLTHIYLYDFFLRARAYLHDIVKMLEVVEVLQRFDVRGKRRIGYNIALKFVIGLPGDLPRNVAYDLSQTTRSK